MAFSEAKHHEYSGTVTSLNGVKDFSLVYPDKEIRLAPLYDAISTIYYPELNTDMAMRIGREYSSDKVTPKDFEQLAGDAGLAKPLVRRRVPELATAAIEALDKINITHKVSLTRSEASSASGARARNSALNRDHPHQLRRTPRPSSVVFDVNIADRLHEPDCLSADLPSSLTP